MASTTDGGQTRGPILEESMLRALAESDPDAWQAELLRPWPGYEDDMSDLMKVARHFAQINGGTLKLLDDCEIDEEEEMVRYVLPEWICAAGKHFQAKHGPELGGVIFSKAMAVFNRHIIPDEETDSHAVEVDRIIRPEH